MGFTNQLKTGGCHLVDLDSVFDLWFYYSHGYITKSTKKLWHRIRSLNPNVCFPMKLADLQSFTWKRSSLFRDGFPFIVKHHPVLPGTPVLPAPWASYAPSYPPAACSSSAAPVHPGQGNRASFQGKRVPGGGLENIPKDALQFPRQYKEDFPNSDSGCQKKKRGNDRLVQTRDFPASNMWTVTHFWGYNVCNMWSLK